MSKNRRQLYAVLNMNGGWRPSYILAKQTSEEEKPALILKFEEERISSLETGGVALLVLFFILEEGSILCSHQQMLVFLHASTTNGAETLYE